MERNILLTLSYEGTKFCGWQRQRGLRTVQGVLESALTRLHGTETPVQGSGRTDSGVHARAQGANFLSPVPGIAPENYVSALNHLLPPDVRIHRAQEKPPDFHARFSALRRTYRYVLHCGTVPQAATAPFVWHRPYFPNPQRLNRMASILCGEVDCSTFAAAGDQSASKCRFLDRAVWFCAGRTLVFEICGNAFLWKMVRSIVGTLVDFERAGKSAADFWQALEARDRRLAGQTAPPQGLFLWDITYGERRGGALGDQRF